MASTSVIKLTILLMLGAMCSAAGTPYQDRETGFTFSSYDVAYKLDKYMTYRVAVPAAVPTGSPFDVIVQIIAPTEVGWAGLAWAGTMVYSPLTVSWKNANAAIISGRWATSYSTPSIDTKAAFEILPKGTHVNTTHWQYTAKCTGCTSWLGRSNFNTTLNANGSNRIAYAWSSTRPSSTTPSATISVHEGAPSSWSQDFSLGVNGNWSTLLVQNLGHA